MRSRICYLLVLLHSISSSLSQQGYNDDGYGDGYADGGYGDNYAEDYNTNDAYQDYGNDGYSQQQDNLYADYAARQEMKEMGNTG